MTDSIDSTAFGAEDAKLVILARGARGRISAAEGAAVRDDTGRTYASASVSLPSLRLSALQAVVAQAAAAGARGLEAAVLVVDKGSADAEGVSAVRDLGGAGVPVHLVSAGGTVTGATRT
ncbi:MAG: cytidine deaminase [Actinomycetia bacterium]|nr:cytidine deaminase [Actinomycetes bacterium]